MQPQNRDVGRKLLIYTILMFTIPIATFYLFRKYALPPGEWIANVPEIGISFASPKGGMMTNHTHAPPCISLSPTACRWRFDICCHQIPKVKTCGGTSVYTVPNPHYHAFNSLPMPLPSHSGFAAVASVNVIIAFYIISAFKEDKDEVKPPAPVVGIWKMQQNKERTD